MEYHFRVLMRISSEKELAVFYATDPLVLAGS